MKASEIRITHGRGAQAMSPLGQGRRRQYSILVFRCHPEQSTSTSLNIGQGRYFAISGSGEIAS
jgi:hypothetical protein